MPDPSSHIGYTVSLVLYLHYVLYASLSSLSRRPVSCAVIVSRLREWRCLAMTAVGRRSARFCSRRLPKSLTRFKEPMDDGLSHSLLLPLN